MTPGDPAPTRTAPKRRPVTPGHRRWSFPLARVLGIQIRVHVSFFLIVALFWLASISPEGPGVIAGMLWLVVIFASVTAHELAHSVVARSRDIPVRAIVLLPIGGVSELGSLADEPEDEFAVSIVGPLTSIVIGAVAGFAAILVGDELFPVDLFDGPLLPRIAWFNVIVAMFNLLPAFPLDGGRVLRSALERRYSLERATRLAARTGRVLAGVMVVVGFVSNFWLVIIGLFVWFGATGEEAATVAHVRLADRRVRDLMIESPAVIDIREPVEHLAGLARAGAQREFPVLQEGRYAGVASVYDYEDAPAGAVVGDVLIELDPVEPDASIEDEAIPRFATGRATALVVVDGGEVIGLLRADDVARAIGHGR